MNGYHVHADGAAGETFIVDDVIVGKADLAEITAWIESRLKAV